MHIISQRASASALGKEIRLALRGWRRDLARVVVKLATRSDLIQCQPQSFPAQSQEAW